MYYLDGTGETRKCAVLYDSSSGYGVQIITMETVGTKSTYLNTQVQSQYSNWISEINSSTNAFLNPTYAESVRCVGSVPDNPSYYEAETLTWGYASFPGKDDNYVTDYNQLSALGIRDINATYWVASRYAEYGYTSASTQPMSASVNIRYIDSNGNLTYCNVYSFSWTSTSGVGAGGTHGIRPVFTLKSGIKITGGSGTSDDPYTLGV